MLKLPKLTIKSCLTILCILLLCSAAAADDGEAGTAPSFGEAGTFDDITIWVTDTGQESTPTPTATATPTPARDPGTTILTPAPAGTFTGGDGTPGNPYQIETADQLDQMRQYLSASFILKSDISLKDRNWQPVGSEATSFTGTLDGSGHTIHDLSSTVDYCGLFDTISGAEIRNLHFANVSLSGYYGGTIAAIAESGTESTISGVSVRNATVTGSGSTGGLIGMGNSISITNCSVTADVAGWRTGSIAGSLKDSTVTDCIAAGTATVRTGNGWGYVGGIAGQVSDGALINRTLSTTMVTLPVINHDQTGLGGGGIVGGSTYNADTTALVTNSVALNKYLNGGNQGRHSGQISGYDRVSVKNCYAWEGMENAYSESGFSGGVNGLPATTEELWNSAAFYTGLGFDLSTDAEGDSLWTAGTEEAFLLPVLRGHPAMSEDAGYFPANGFGGGDGSADNPYRVESVHQMHLIREDLAAHYTATGKVSDTISLKDTAWEPIGSAAEPFTGTFAGNGLTVTGISVPSSLEGGLFGALSNAEITGLRLRDVTVTGDIAGTLAGTADTTVIQNISVRNATVTGSSSAGGLIGSTTGGSADQISVEAHISSSGSAGGLVGSSGGQLTDAVFLGTVRGTTGTGGLTGQSSGDILRGIALGTVSGTAGSAGGLAGTIVSGTVTDSAALLRETGSSDPDQAGTVAGSGPVENCAAWEGMKNPAGTTFGGTNGTAVPSVYVWDNTSLFAGDLGFAISTDPDADTLWTTGTIRDFGNANMLPQIRGHPVMSDVSYLVPMEFAGGSGTADDPYKISSANQFDAIRYHLSSSFILINDISLEGVDWQPVGSGAVPFTGTLDGAGYTIHNVTLENRISDETNMYSPDIGLFIETSDATFKNINFDNVTVAPKEGAHGGLIAANARNTVISNVSVRNGEYSNLGTAGGLVGYYYGGSRGLIENCSAELNISGGVYVGGLAGWAIGGDFTNCITTGTVKAASKDTGTIGSVAYSGGIVGRGNGVITNCISACRMETTRNIVNYATVGGIVGWEFATGAATDAIVNSIALPRYISGDDRNNGGIVGALESNNPTFSLDTDYTWDGIDNARSDNFNGNSGNFVSSAQVWDNAAFYTSVGYDMENIWEIGTRDIYKIPQLRGQPMMQADVSYLNPETDISFDSGSGTAEDPYNIVSAKQLNNMHLREKYLSAHFVLMRDVSLAAYDWQPVGSTEKPFTGTFSGNGHTVSNVRITGTGTAGLFGQIQNAEITGLFVSNVTVSASGEYAGGIAGRAVDSVIRGSGVRAADITASGKYAGGVVGSLEGTGELTRVSAGGSVAATQYAGGIAGYTEVTISDAVSGGSVTASGEYAGGIAGSGSADRAVSTASVTASRNAGGITGTGTAADSLAFNQAVSGAKASTGTVAGSGSVSGTFAWDSITNPAAGSFGGPGGTAVDSETLWNNFAFYTGLGWDFAAGSGESLWTLGTEEEFLLPVLSGQPAMGVNALFLGPTVGKFTEGSGTVADPYHVTTDLQLNNVRNYPSSHFVLTNDISLVNFSAWEPIGSSSSSAFRGTFNGSGYTIRDVSFSGSGIAGLFGYTNGAVFSNLHLNTVTISATSAAGSLVAKAAATTIANCSVRAAAVVTTGNPAGMLVGEAAKGSMITNCSVSGSVTALQNAGGIAGSTAAVIANCTAAGSVTGTGGLAGGIVGQLTGGSVEYCFVNCLVTTPDATENFGLGSQSGGIAGSLGSTATTAEISHSAAVGKTVDGNYTESVGRVAGAVRDGGTVQAVYAWDGMKNPSGGSFGGSNGLNATKVQLWNSSVFYQNVLGFDMTNVWEIGTEKYYQLPVLRGHPVTGGYAKHLAPNEFAGGEGSVDNPYVIYTADQLNAVRGDELASHFVLAADISLVNVSDWEPIGNAGTAFTGTFDGRGYTISDLTTTGFGLFGTVSGAAIANLNLENVSISHGSGYNAASLAGELTSSSLVNCSVRNASVTAKGWSGGVVGIVSGTSSITRCSFAGSVNVSMDRAGGILGSPLTGGVVTIEDCVAAGSVSATSGYAGGIAGYLTEGSLLRHVISTVEVKSGNAVTSNAGSVYGFGEKVYAYSSVGASRYVDGKDATTTGAFAGKTAVKTFTDNRNWEGTTNRLGDLGGKKANTVVAGSVLWDSAAVYRTAGFDMENVWTMGTEELFLLPVLAGHPAMISDAGYLVGLSPEEPEIPEPQVTENTVTDGTWSAAVPARVVYEFVPAAAANVSVPVITRGSQTLALSENVAVEMYAGGVWSPVSASVTDGKLAVSGDVTGAEKLRATFTGRRLGDVTNDEKINVYDAQRISRYAAGTAVFDEAEMFFADVTGDGKINVYDAQRISRYAAGTVNEHYS